MDECRKAYKQREKDLRKTISRTKAAARNELTNIINRDLWGFPYCIALKRLRTASPSMSELEEDVLNKLLKFLFPGGKFTIPRLIG